MNFSQLREPFSPGVESTKKEEIPLVYYGLPLTYEERRSSLILKIGNRIKINFSSVVAINDEDDEPISQDALEPLVLAKQLAMASSFPLVLKPNFNKEAREVKVFSLAS